MVSYTRSPVTMEAMKVPRIAKVMIAPKFEKKGFCQKQNLICLGVSLQLMEHQGTTGLNNSILTGAKLNPD